MYHSMHHRPWCTQSGSKHIPDDIGVQQFSVVHKLPFSIHTETYTSLHEQGAFSASQGTVEQLSLSNRPDMQLFCRLLPAASELLVQLEAFTCRAMYFTATNSCVRLLRINLISPFRPDPSSPTHSYFGR